VPDARSAAHPEADDPARQGTALLPRATALERARRIAQVGRGAMALTCAWLVLWPVPYALVVTLAAATPWLALLLCRKYRGLFAIDKPGRGTHRGDLTLLLALPGGVLAMRAIADSHLVIVGPLFLPALALWGALAWCAHALGPGWRGWRNFMLLLVIAFPYAPSTLALANQAFDLAAPTPLRVAVTGKRMSAARGRILYLRVPPWGLRRRANEVEVARELYDAVPVGGWVCLQLHPGALGMPWYEAQAVERC
jgi:hypothetical protein